MSGSPQSDDQALSERRRHTAHDDPTSHPDAHVNLPANLGERELEAALQLLVERAQYITGATGTALALPQGDEMVCRASAGACAPTVGARLQVRSGLTGESIARRQLLRCDNAETDPRVNLETCHALGIASIVVLPLLRRTGEVRGLFELFSDHPYAFEERDLVALERMAALTLTALDLAEQQHDSVAPTAAPVRQTKPAAPGTNPPANTTYSPKDSPARQPANLETHADVRVASVPFEPASAPAPSKPAQAAELPSAMSVAAAQASIPVTAPAVESAATFASIMPSPVIESSPPEPAPVPEAMRRVQKCASCGFPVSEGRTLCLDCESLERMKVESEKKAREKAALEIRRAEATGGEVENAEATTDVEAKETNPEETREDHLAELSGPPDEILPRFLTDTQLVEESWLARHVNLLAFLVLVAAVLVAAVVFFR